MNKYINSLMDKLKYLSDEFANNGVTDIYTNSKIYEVLIANQFAHKIINGHAYTYDAKNKKGEFYEYKHFKKSSSNHTWTFNDFSNNTINRLKDINYVVFVIIEDRMDIPNVEKAYFVPSINVSNYLYVQTPKITNTRDMINISPRQVECYLNPIVIEPENAYYSDLLLEVFETVHALEKYLNIQGLLTSNKLWELLVAMKLGHTINSEQKKHDAIDADGKTYEYKVSIKKSWTFQDISDNVLDSYIDDELIVLAIVNKVNFTVKKIYICNPCKITEVLREKRKILIEHSNHVKRLSVNFGASDLNNMIMRGEAKCIL